MRIKYLIIISTILFPWNIFSQSGTVSVNPNKLIVNPKFFGMQIEAVTIIATNEIGVSGDYDIYTSINNKYNFGLRISSEYYKISDFDVGGGNTYGPFLDFSILGLHSLRGKYFWFSPLIGLSLHNILEETTSDSKIVLKWGLELKYNLFNDNIGLLLKFLGSPTINKGYGGIGISIGFYNN